MVSVTVASTPDTGWLHGLVGDGAIRHLEMRLFKKPLAVNQQKEVITGRGWLPRERRLIMGPMMCQISDQHSLAA